MANYIELITKVYKQLDLPFNDNDIMTTYNSIVKVPEKEAEHTLQTMLIKQTLCKKLTNKNIADAGTYLKSQGIATGISSSLYGVNNETLGQPLKANSYLTVHKKILNTLNIYKLVIIYSIPHKKFFVIDSKKLKNVDKIEAKYSYLVETKEFVDFEVVYHISKILKSL